MAVDGVREQVRLRYAYGMWSSPGVDGESNELSAALT